MVLHAVLKTDSKSAQETYSPNSKLDFSHILIFQNVNFPRVDRICFIISAQFIQFLSLSLTALPVGMAQLQVSAGAGRVLLGPLWATDVLDLVVEGFESGIDLCIMLTKIPSSLVSPHVPERIRRLFCLTQTGKGRHVDTRTGRTRRTRGSRVSRRTLRDDSERKD